MRILLLSVFLFAGLTAARSQPPELQIPADSVSQEAPVKEAAVIEQCDEEEAVEAVAKEPLFEGMPDVMPTFNGGDIMSFHRWVMMQIRYPQEVLEDGIQGRVLVEYVIEKDGSVSDIRIQRSVDKRLSAEVMRVFGLEIPVWTPAMCNGKPLRMKFTIPVDFRYQ